MYDPPNSDINQESTKRTVPKGIILIVAILVVLNGVFVLVNLLGAYEHRPLVLLSWEGVSVYFVIFALHIFAIYCTVRGKRQIYWLLSLMFVVTVLSYGPYWVRSGVFSGWTEFSTLIIPILSLFALGMARRHRQWFSSS